MPLGYRGGSPAGYASKLAVALGESPGPDGIRTLFQSIYSFQTFLEAFKTLDIAGYASRLETPRDIEIAARRWVATRLAQARLYAKGVYELINLAYSAYIGARDVSMLLRMAYAGEEPPPPDELAADSDPIASTVYTLYLETRSFRGIVDGLRRGRYYRLADLIDRFVKMVGPNGIDIAVDYYIAYTFSKVYREHAELRFYLCPRLDILYARASLAMAMRGCPRDVVASMLEALRPCKLPELSREMAVGDWESVILKLRSTFYGEITEQDPLKAFSLLEGMMRKEARRRAAMGIGFNPMTPQYAIAAQEYITLDAYDVTLLANAAYSRAERGEVEQLLSY